MFNQKGHNHHFYKIDVYSNYPITQTRYINKKIMEWKGNNTYSEGQILELMTVRAEVEANLIKQVININILEL